MEQSKVQSNLSKLPGKCYGVLLSLDAIIEIRAGEHGYYCIDTPLQHPHGLTTDQWVDELNAVNGITKAQRMAMEHGSMWGWETPGADPERWVKLFDKVTK